jgi:ankyrin repeat protein
VYKDKYTNYTDINIVLNMHLNGRTLMYTACREGKLDIVKYLLSLDVNPHIKSILDDNEIEDCLQVACRWNYPQVVNALLQRGKYSKVELKNAFNITKSEKVKHVLMRYLKIISRSMCC